MIREERTATGRVRWWSASRSEGVIASPEVPYGCLVPGEALRAVGLDRLQWGAPVRFRWTERQGEDVLEQVAVAVEEVGDPVPGPVIRDDDLLEAYGAVRGDLSDVVVELEHTGTARLRFRVAPAPDVWAVDLPLASRAVPKPWLYRAPWDACDAAAMLSIMLDEAVSTGCRTYGRREDIDGARLLHLAPYGIEFASRREHELEIAERPFGWHGWIQENDPLE